MNIKYPIKFIYTFSENEIVGAFETGVINGVSIADTEIDEIKFCTNIYPAQN